MRTAGSRIVIVDTHSMFADALEVALGIEGYDVRQVELRQEQASRARLLSDVRRLRPRFVLLSLDLGAYGRGVDLIAPLTAEGITVVVVTSETNRARWGECITQGARGVIPKEAPFRDLLDAIYKLGNGRRVMSREERIELVECWHREQAAEREILAGLDRLTRREAEVLGMLMEGMQVGDIARERYVSESTVRTQVKSILAKLQVSSQLTAVGLARQARWTAPKSVDRPSSTAARMLHTQRIRDTADLVTGRV
jgi:DNA-binding NarL/FixJ family response regulator